jgi:hypothetical protein
LPIRAISQIFGCGVDWDGETRTVLLTTGGSPLFGDNPYVPLRMPTEDENAVFRATLDGASDSTTHNQMFIDWLYANTDVLVRYASYYGDETLPLYGSLGYHMPWYETEAIRTHFSGMVGENDRETATNVVQEARSMTVYKEHTFRLTELAELSGTPPYGQDCEGSSNLVVAGLKAVGVPAFSIGISNRSHAFVACYLQDEGVWEFIEATATPKSAAFLERRQVDAGYVLSNIQLHGNAAFDYEVYYNLLDLSYFLHYVMD